MKKILFASTALVLTAGVAAAEVTMGGYGRFGLAYNEGATGTAKETRVEQRFRITFTAATETDAGVKVEGRFRLQSDEGSNGGASGDGPGAAGFAVSYGGLRVDVGHVSDALDSGDVVDFYGYGVGLTSFIENNASFDDFDANGFGNGDIDTQIVKVLYSVGDFSVNAAYAEDNDAEGVDSYYQIGLGYNFGAVNVGAVYGERDDMDSTSYWVLGASGSFGAIGYNVLVGDSDGQEDASYSASLKYDVSSATELRFVVADGGDDVADETDDTAYGIGFRHSLGGGVSLRGGVGQNTAGNTLADLGVHFDF